ncbi:hypothetical protein ABIE50_002541 [Chitinophaga sp. OAE865]
METAHGDATPGSTAEQLQEMRQVGRIGATWRLKPVD